MQNKHKPVYRFPKGCDITYWSIWDELHPDFTTVGELHAQGLNEERRCPKCGSSELIPEFVGSIDIGYKLVYFCPCKNLQVRFWTEGYEYE